MPPDAVSGGQENGKPLWVCRAEYNGAVHPGKVIGSNCNIGWGTSEIALPVFDILRGSPEDMHWVQLKGGDAPAQPVEGGTEGGKPLPVCRVPYNGGLHPGKLASGNCYIGWGGKAVGLSTYEVLAAGKKAPAPGAAPFAAAPNSQWRPGSYLVHSQLNGRCLDVTNARFQPGNRLQAWTCRQDNPAQVFEFTADHQIRSGGLCLNILGGVARPGDAVGLWPCEGGPNEKWDLVEGRLVGMKGRCIDISGANYNNGAAIIVWDCAANANNQAWTLARAQSLGTAQGRPQSVAPDCADCPPWVERSFAGNLLPLAHRAGLLSQHKPFSTAAGPMTVQSRFLGQKGTTCRFEVQFHNVGTRPIDERLIIARPGKAALGNMDFPLEARLAPGTSAGYETEIRECPLNWGETQEMGKCAACEPLVYFVAK